MSMSITAILTLCSVWLGVTLGWVTINEGCQFNKTSLRSKLIEIGFTEFTEFLNEGSGIQEHIVLSCLETDLVPCDLGWKRPRYCNQDGSYSVSIMHNSSRYPCRSKKEAPLIEITMRRGKEDLGEVVYILNKLGSLRKNQKGIKGMIESCKESGKSKTVTLLYPIVTIATVSVIITFTISLGVVMAIKIKQKRQGYTMSLYRKYSDVDTETEVVTSI